LFLIFIKACQLVLGNRRHIFHGDEDHLMLFSLHL